MSFVVRTRSLALAVAALTALAVLTAPTTADAQSLDETTRKRQQLESELAAAAEAYETVLEDLYTAETELADLERRTLELEALAAEVDHALSMRARAIYKRGDVNVLSAVLGSDGASGVIDRAELLQVLNTRDLGNLEGAVALRTQLHQSRALLADKAGELDAITASLAAREADLDRRLTSTKVLESELKTRKARQTTLTNGLQNGTYACIIARPFHYRNTWGAPRSGGRRHKGTDVFGQWNAQVYAITNGRIARFSSSRLGGIGLYLKGDDGHLYYYAHLNGFADGMSVGKRVEAGQFIAYNGDSGNARGGAPHIHFQVHPNGGGPVNPYHWLTPLC